MEKKFGFSYVHYDAPAQLSQDDRELVAAAEQATRSAYAPFSKFRVGAAARLRSGRSLSGSNIESEVFPAGLCAERTLLFHAAACHPDDPVVTLAIASDPSASGDGRCGTSSGIAHAGDYERRRHGLRGGDGPHAAPFYL